jgi:hypothetical protein
MIWHEGADSLSAEMKGVDRMIGPFGVLPDRKLKRNLHCRQQALRSGLQIGCNGNRSQP